MLGEPPGSPRPLPLVRLRGQRLPPRVVSGCVGDRLQETTLGIAEEEADRYLVVALLVLDSEVAKPRGDLGPLLVRDTNGDVVARSAAFVERETCVSDVGHHRVTFGADDAGAEDALVKRGGGVGVVRLEGGVVDPRHGPECKRRVTVA